MVGALALVAVACSDGGTDSTAGGTVAPAATAENASVTTVAAAAITVTPLDPGVEVNSGSAGFVAITGPTEVAAGDVVRTDGTGFAEINYPDGRSRLDVGTGSGVSITDDAAPPPRRARRWRVWTRPNLSTEAGSASTPPSVSPPSTVRRGRSTTAGCACQFTVLEGKVDVVPPTRPHPLGGPYTVMVDEVRRRPRCPCPDEAFSDVDGRKPNSTRTPASSAPCTGLAAPGLVRRPVQRHQRRSAAECAASANCSTSVGGAYTFDYVFSVECNGFMHCTRSVDMTYTKDGVTAQARATVGFFGSSYFWTLDLGGSGCDAANPGNVLFSLTPLAAVKADGKWLITEVALVAAPDEGTGCGGTGSGSGDDCHDGDDDHDDNDHKRQWLPGSRQQQRQPQQR
jgi:hypothetical protein